MLYSVKVREPRLIRNVLYVWLFKVQQPEMALVFINSWCRCEYNYTIIPRTGMMFPDDSEIFSPLFL